MVKNPNTFTAGRAHRRREQKARKRMGKTIIRSVGLRRAAK